MLSFLAFTQNLGRNHQVTNPTTGGQYRVSIRGFDAGDNCCECIAFPCSP